MSSARLKRCSLKPMNSTKIFTNKEILLKTSHLENRIIEKLTTYLLMKLKWVHEEIVHINTMPANQNHKGKIHHNFSSEKSNSVYI